MRPLESIRHHHHDDHPRPHSSQPANPEALINLVKFVGITLASALQLAASLRPIRTTPLEGTLMTTINWTYVPFDAPAGTVPTSVKVTVANADPAGVSPAPVSVPTGTNTVTIAVDPGTYTITVQDMDDAGQPAGPAATAQLIQGPQDGTVSIQVPSGVTTV